MTEDSLFLDEGKWGLLDPETLFSRKWGFGGLSGVGGIPTLGIFSPKFTPNFTTQSAEKTGRTFIFCTSAGRLF